MIIKYKGVRIDRSYHRYDLVYKVDGEDLRNKVEHFVMGYEFYSLLDAMAYIDAVIKGDIVE